MNEAKNIRPEYSEPQENISEFRKLLEQINDDLAESRKLVVSGEAYLKDLMDSREFSRELNMEEKLPEWIKETEEGIKQIKNLIAEIEEQKKHYEQMINDLEKIDDNLNRALSKFHSKTVN